MPIEKRTCPSVLSGSFCHAANVGLEVVTPVSYFRVSSVEYERNRARFEVSRPVRHTGRVALSGTRSFAARNRWGETSRCRSHDLLAATCKTEAVPTGTRIRVHPVRVPGPKS